MASEGPNSAGAGGSEGSGTFSWSNTGNILASDDSYANTSNSSQRPWRQNTLFARKASGPVGSDGAVFNTALPTSDTVAEFGAADDLWGTTWTPAEINDSTFGVGLTLKNNLTSVSNTLVASSFGFSIPSDATIDGFVVQIEWKYVSGGSGGPAHVDHISITVYYTEAAGGPSIPIAAYHYNHHLQSMA